ncbi:MSHA biogenesis protein MshJ [Neptunicella marina]|uniref:MSHA biogenesis protein MshJ n=1 Tax=Neptunicella marina TaxID=2125989 RepID=A0A8J6M2D0_9ALTE|nr:MSHA biogenesis protein MshJ [Neptunicella marina]MBC3766102.1 MSHA biogenesis protein MshJ [Neptunicella marina]
MAESRWRKLGVQFYALSIREKSLILLAGLLLIILGGYLWVIDGQLSKMAGLEQQLKTNKSQYLGLQGEVAELQLALSKDPDKILQQQIDELISRNNALDDSLNSQTAKLVPADRMPQLLISVLNKSHKVKLVSMESLEPVISQLEDDRPNAKVHIYQHGVRIKLQGSYFDIADYLQSLKTSPLGFDWRAFDYQVTNYPIASVTLELYTLSTSEAFIGI